MQHLLIRSGVNPYDSYSTREYLSRDLGGGNSGNLLFAASVFRNVYREDRKLDSNYYSLDLSKIDEINEKYTAFICPLANAFRENFREIGPLTQFIKKLKIPCVVTGVGGQFEYDPNFDNSFEFDEKSKEFCYAVLDKSETIGVRGEITATYLKKRLGIPESRIEVIGCPSLFYFGDKAPELKRYSEYIDSSVSFHGGASAEKKVWSDILNVAKYSKKRYFVPQANYDLNILYNGIPFKKLSNAYPTSLQHPLYKHDKVRFFTRADSWIHFYQKNIDYSIGIKIHGTIAAILGGCRTLLIGTDSRTRELAEFHHIPLVKYDAYKSIYELMDKMTDPHSMDDFYNAYKEGFDNFKLFMKKNGVLIDKLNSKIENVGMIEKYDEGDVTPFMRLNSDQKIIRIEEVYKTFQNKISVLKKK